MHMSVDLTSSCYPFILCVHYFNSSYYTMTVPLKSKEVPYNIYLYTPIYPNKKETSGFHGTVSFDFVKKWQQK